MPDWVQPSMCGTCDTAWSSGATKRTVCIQSCEIAVILWVQPFVSVSKSIHPLTERATWICAEQPTMSGCRHWHRHTFRKILTATVLQYAYHTLLHPSSTSWPRCPMLNTLLDQSNIPSSDVLSRYRCMRILYLKFITDHEDSAQCLHMILPQVHLRKPCYDFSFL